MLIAALLVLSLQQAGAPIVWAEPAAEAVTAPPVVAPAPSLPEWALADPFAWERSQCSPLVRRDEPLPICQQRVRSDLAANLGDALPTGLQPAPLIEGCASVPGEGGAYGVSCGPRARPDRPLTASVEQVCETRPQRQGRSVAWTEVCRPASGQAAKDEGLRIKLFGDD